MLDPSGQPPLQEGEVVGVKGEAPAIEPAAAIEPALLWRKRVKGKRGRSGGRDGGGSEGERACRRTYVDSEGEGEGREEEKEMKMEQDRGRGMMICSSTPAS